MDAARLGFHTPSMKRAALAGIMVVAAVSCSRASSPAATPFPRCQTSTLRLSFVGPDMFMHSFIFIYGLRNTGSRTCTMEGYPTITGRHPTGGSFVVKVQHLAAWGPPTTVTIHPGQTAGLYLANGRMPPACRRGAIWGDLEVIPPGASVPLTIPTPARGACPGQVLFVSPIQSSTAAPTS